MTNKAEEPSPVKRYERPPEHLEMCDFVDVVSFEQAIVTWDPPLPIELQKRLYDFFGALKAHRVVGKVWFSYKSFGFVSIESMELRPEETFWVSNRRIRLQSALGIFDIRFDYLVSVEEDIPTRWILKFKEPKEDLQERMEFVLADNEEERSDGWAY